MRRVVSCRLHCDLIAPFASSLRPSCVFRFPIRARFNTDFPAICVGLCRCSCRRLVLIATSFFSDPPEISSFSGRDSEPRLTPPLRSSMFQARALPAFMRPGGGMVSVAYFAGCDASTIVPGSSGSCQSIQLLLGYTTKVRVPRE